MPVGRKFINITYKPNGLFQSPYHEGSKVTTLFHSCIQLVAGNLQDYDLHDFPDEFVIKYVSQVDHPIPHH